MSLLPAPEGFTVITVTGGTFGTPLLRCLRCAALLEYDVGELGKPSPVEQADAVLHAAWHVAAEGQRQT